MLRVSEALGHFWAVALITRLIDRFFFLGAKQLTPPANYHLEERTWLGSAAVVGSKLYALGKPDNLLSLYELNPG